MKLTDEYYSIQEVADKLKVAYLTVYRWIRSGNLEAYKFGKQYRIKKNDFVRYEKLSKRKKKHE